MARKFFIILVCLLIFGATTSRPVLGLNVPTPDYSGSNQNLKCVGPIAKILCVFKKISDYMQTIEKITKALDYAPHQFPFGGPILSSEQACTFKFDEYTRIPNPACLIPGVCGTLTPPTILAGPLSVPIFLSGRAIVVGPPIPTYPDPGTFDFSTGAIPPGGKIIAFPWISGVYRNHTENRVGPWALGLGFSPFPLGEINNALKDIVITLAPSLLDLSCSQIALLSLSTLTSGSVSQVYICADNFRLDCQASGEKDLQGKDIYKVIRKLGTSRDNAPASAFPTGFPVP